jgi:hypothetical protein
VEDMIISVLAFLTLVSAGFAVLTVLIGALGVLTGSRFERCPRCRRLGLMNDGWPQHRGCSRGQLVRGGGGINSTAEVLGCLKDGVIQDGVSNGTSYGTRQSARREPLLGL